MEPKQQRDWLTFFERTEKQREARERLIRELPADQRVKDLLLALADLSGTAPDTVCRPDGTVEFSVPMSTIAWKLGKKENTAKSYIDLAGLTPYLNVRPRQHRPHTYLLRWQAIVDSPPRAESSVRSCEDADNATVRVSARGSTRGSIDPPPGGQTAPQQGVNEGVNWGPKGGSIGPLPKTRS